MASNVSQKVTIPCLKDAKLYEKVYWTFIWPTLFVMYNGSCSLCNTTNLLKDGGFASISPPYDKNSKMGAFVLFP